VSTPEAIVYDPRSMSFRRRMLVRLAVAAAQLLARQPPRRIRKVLSWLRRGAEPATFAQAKAARDAVIAVSLACAGREGCLARSLATIVYCRLHGQSATRCLGARRVPPFGAHAWIEVDGIAVDEPYPPDYFRTFFMVP
jgi:Transglutaminase-like superfamily